MNFNDLAQLVDDQRRDITSNFVDSDEIKRYMNQCGRNLQADHDFDFTATSCSFTYSTPGKYALSAFAPDFKSPIDLFIGYANKMNLVTLEDFNVLSAVGGYVYAIQGDYLWINNPSTVTAVSVNYYSEYMAKTSGGTWIAELSTASDIPLLPTRYQDLYSDYALRQIFAKEALTDDYTIANTRYEKKIRDLKNEYISRRNVVLRRMKHINEQNGAVIFDRKENPLQQ